VRIIIKSIKMILPSARRVMLRLWKNSLDFSGMLFHAAGSSPALSSVRPLFEAFECHASDMRASLHPETRHQHSFTRATLRTASAYPGHPPRWQSPSISPLLHKLRKKDDLLFAITDLLRALQFNNR